MINIIFIFIFKIAYTIKENLIFIIPKTQEKQENTPMSNNIRFGHP